MDTMDMTGVVPSSVRISARAVNACEQRVHPLEPKWFPSIRRLSLSPRSLSPSSSWRWSSLTHFHTHTHARHCTCIACVCSALLDATLRRYNLPHLTRLTRQHARRAYPSIPHTELARMFIAAATPHSATRRDRWRRPGPPGV